MLQAEEPFEQNHETKDNATTGQTTPTYGKRIHSCKIKNKVACKQTPIVSK
jgi:hypothetical protein